MHKNTTAGGRVSVGVCVRPPATRSNKMRRFMRSQSLRAHATAPPMLDARAGHNNIRAWASWPAHRANGAGRDGRTRTVAALIGRRVAFDEQINACTSDCEGSERPLLSDGDRQEESWNMTDKISVSGISLSGLSRMPRSTCVILWRYDYFSMFEKSFSSSFETNGSEYNLSIFFL